MKFSPFAVFSTLTLMARLDAMPMNSLSQKMEDMRFSKGVTPPAWYLDHFKTKIADPISESGYMASVSPKSIDTIETRANQLESKIARLERVLGQYHSKDHQNNHSNSFERYEKMKMYFIMLSSFENFGKSHAAVQKLIKELKTLEAETLEDMEDFPRESSDIYRKFKLERQKMFGDIARASGAVEASYNSVMDKLRHMDEVLADLAEESEELPLDSDDELFSVEMD